MGLLRIPLLQRLPCTLQGLRCGVPCGLLGQARRTGAPSLPQEATRDPAAESLERAWQTLEQGDPEKAHQMALALPQSSNLRQSPTFKLIESSWADYLLSQAEAASDRDTQRSLLQRVATAESVDGLRRQRAADELKKLESANVDVAALPKSRPLGGSEVTPAGAQSAAQAPAVAGTSGTLSAAAAPATPALSSAPAAVNVPATPSAAPAPKPSPSPRLEAIKNSLKQRVADGIATQQEEWQCRQIGRAHV